MNYELGIRKKMGETKFWEWLFLAFLFLLPWQTRLILRPGILNSGNWEYGMIGVYGTEVLLWAVAIIWGIEKIKERDIGYWILDIKRKFIQIISNIQYSISIISIISLIFISLFVSADKMVAWQSWRYIFEAGAVLFLIKRFSRRDWLIWSFLAGLTIQSILAIGQFLTQTTFASRWLGLTLHPAWQAGSAVLENGAGRWLRAYGGLPHPNILGGYLAVGLILIIICLQITDFYKYTNKILLFSVYCLLLTALFFTFSRSAWLAFFVVLLFHGFIAIRDKKFLIRQLADNISRRNVGIPIKASGQYFVAPVILFAIYSLLFTPLINTRLNIVERLEVQSTTERLSGYSEAWQLFKKNPLLGVGLGNYTLAVHRELDSSRPAWAYQPAHNVFVLMTAELGITGAMLLLVFLFFIVKDIKILDINNIQSASWRTISPPALLRNAKRAGNILVLFFILGLFDHYLWSLYSGWMLLAVGGGLILTNQTSLVS